MINIDRQITIKKSVNASLELNLSVNSSASTNSTTHNERNNSSAVILLNKVCWLSRAMKPVLAASSVQLSPCHLVGLNLY